MPVSTGNEEAKVFTRRSSDISSGIPLKKRRFMMVHSSTSPPPKDPPAAFSEGTDVKRNEESSSDSKPKTNELVRSDSQGNEASDAPGITKDVVVEDVKNQPPAGINSQDKVVKSGVDSRDKEEPPSSDQATTGKSVIVGPDAGKVDLNLLEVKKEIVPAPSVSLSMDVVVPDLPELRPVVESDTENRVENRTELQFFTGHSAPLGAPRSSGNPSLVNVKREMEGKQVEDCNLKLSTVSGNDDDEKKLGSKEFLRSGSGKLNISSDIKVMPASVLSLSLNKEVSSDGKIVSANRSNWDLNTTMDVWEGSNADAAIQSHVDGSAKKTESIHRSLSSGAISILKGKGKQVISTREPIPSLSTSSLQLPEDSLSLTLSPSFHKPNFARVLSGLSTNIGPRRDVQNPFDDSSINKSTLGFRVVKSEPADGNPTATSGNATELLLDASFLKRDTIEKQKTQALTLTVSSPQNSTEQKGIKSEPMSEAGEGMCSIGLTIHQPSSSTALTMPVTPPNPSPARLPASSELSLSADVSNQSEYSVQAKESPSRTGVLVQSGTDINPSPGGKDEIFTDINVGNTTLVATNVNESKPEKVKDPLHDSRANVEGSASDEEKINISAIMEDESYGSDYESDSNQALGNQLGKPKRGARDDEEYEDGEVRESLLKSKTEKPPTTTSGTSGDGTKLIADNNDSSSGFLHGTEQVQLDDKDNELKIQENATPGNNNDNVRLISNDKSDQFLHKDGHSQNLSLDGMAEPVVHEIDMEICNSDQRKSGDSGGDKSCAESSYKDSYPDNSGQGIVTAGEPKGEMFNTAERINSSYQIVEASLNDTNAAKDSNLGGSRSRIINLPRATSPSRTRSIPDKLLSSRNGRERYSDLDGEKFYLRGNRDEMGTDGSHRYGRERFQDQPFRNSRGGYYSRGRGRFSGRHSNSRSEWSSDRDFSMGSYNDEYRFTRNKRAMPTTELDCDDYVPSDNVGRGRGRRSLNDDMPSFRHQSSRRFSPGSRDGPTSRGSELVRRVSRNISPISRRNEENGMGMVSLRHDDKFVRVLSDDMADHGYSRQHSTYEGGDGQFIRGNRNLPTFQRRGFQRTRSKSPVGSRTWSSPRRRSPDGFNGLPQMFGVERMRSPPDRSCFPEQQMVSRRRVSPYMARPANDSRDGDPSRPMNSSRRSPPPERVFNFGGRPVHSGRFHEFHTDGNNSSNDERRKFGDRRGISRPFKPTYMVGNDGDTGSHSHSTTRFHPDDGSRPMRFCSDADQEFSGRGGGMREREREREFDGRMKNRQIGDPPRRMRNMDDQEGSYRNSGQQQQQQQQQVWHDEGGFSEGSGFKRRRFLPND